MDTPPPLTTAETSPGTSVSSVRYGTVSDRSWGGGCPGAVLITTASLNTEIVQHVSTLRTYNTQTEAKWRPSLWGERGAAPRRAVASPLPLRAPPRRAVLPSTFHSRHPLLSLTARSSQSRAATYRLTLARDPCISRRGPRHTATPTGFAQFVTTKCNVIFLYFEYRYAFVMNWMLDACWRGSETNRLMLR